MDIKSLPTVVPKDVPKCVLQEQLLFLERKGYDKSFTKDQAKELLRNLKSGNRA